ncbi:hypothetical protein HN011_010073 [Eciton burchellii]|nr:hypothetical protein HN011_010073 [Eciton burchellii]
MWDLLDYTASNTKAQEFNESSCALYGDTVCALWITSLVVSATPTLSLQADFPVRSSNSVSRSDEFLGKGSHRERRKRNRDNSTAQRL